LGYVALQSTDVDFAASHAHDILGLNETGRSGNAIFLSSAARVHHELVYIDSSVNGVSHFGLVANGLAGLDTVRARVKDEGFEIVSEVPLHPGVTDGFAFRGPEDFVYEIYTEMESVDFVPLGHGPDRYGHINLHPQDPTAYKDFLVNVLDFKISDVIGNDFVYFLRCNTEHHGIALVRGRGWLHHHAWQAQSIVELGKLGDRLFESGARLLMGPVRHGETGRNIAAYYVEPTGSVVELYTDMRHIYDDDAPISYMDADGLDWATQWAIYDFAEFRSHGLFPAKEILSTV
jgi:catechol-2,3-dioxygenase